MNSQYLSLLNRILIAHISGIAGRHHHTVNFVRAERVHGYSQMVGLVLILSLMVYVTFNDIARWLVQ